MRGIGHLFAHYDRESSNQKGNDLSGKAIVSSSKADRSSCLPENQPISGYSTVSNEPGKDEGETGLYLYDCYFWIKKKLFPPRIKAEAKAQLPLALGICASTVFGFFIPLTTTFIVGQKGKIALAAVGLGWSVCNVSGHVYVIGVTSVCETYFSQAYGAKNMKKYGVILQRAIILTYIAILPSCALWINMDQILLLLGQDREVAILAGQFALWYIPGIFCFIFYNLLLRYLACQSIVYPSVYGALAAFLVNGICCYVFAHVYDFGLRGGALAISAAYLTYCVVLLFFIFWKNLYRDTWYGWSLDCLCEWKGFITLSASSIVMSVSEWACFELGIIVLGILGSLEQAVQVVLYNVAGMVFFMSLSLSIAAAVRVGNFIGSGEVALAKLSARVSVQLTVMADISIGLFLFALHDVIVYVFTSDRSVIKIASNLIYLIAIVEIFDGLQVVLRGVVRGLGYQKFGAIINFLAFLCLATLIYMLLIFKAHLGVFGYWIGVFIAIIVQNIALLVLLYKIKWREISQKIRENVGIEVESTLSGHALKSDDDKDERETNDLKLESCHSGGCPTDGAQSEDVHLITETSLSDSGDNGHSAIEGNTERFSATEDTVEHPDKTNDSERFFVYQRPHFSKLDIFIKISAVSILLSGVMASAIVRSYR